MILAKGDRVQFTEMSNKVDTNLLCILEMWFSLVFQSIPQKFVKLYLPPGTQIYSPNRHLNGESPLASGQSSMALAQLIQSSDPVVAAWARARCVAHIAEVRDKGVRENIKAALDNGPCLTKIPSRGPLGTIHVRQVGIGVTKTMQDTLGAKPGDKVNVLCDLLPPRQTHPHVAALKRQEGDPAARLGVKISGPKGSLWWTTPRDQNTKGINSLVDELGDDKDETKTRPRRYFIHEAMDCCPSKKSCNCLSI